MADRYCGVIVPLLTPIRVDGRIDEAAAERLVDHVVGAGGHPFVLGTTGEGASVSREMGEVLLRRVVGHTAGRATVYAGVSTNALGNAVETGRRYLELGADAVVVHPPCYFEPGSEGLLAFYERLADALGGPMLIYNIPMTTRISIPLDVVETLSRHPNIVGLKDSEPDRERMREALDRFAGRDDFVVLVGASRDGAFGVARGATGTVPGGANLLPELYRRLHDAAASGDTDTAEELQRLADRLDAICFDGRSLGAGLAALKVIAAELGLCEPHMLPPLTRLPPAEEARLLAMWNKLERQVAMFELRTPARRGSA